MFTYEKLVSKMSLYGAVSAGRSVWGRELWYCRIGGGEKSCLFAERITAVNTLPLSLPRIYATILMKEKIPTGRFSSCRW